MKSSAKSVISGEIASREVQEVSPLSRELVMGFVGYVGSGCSTAAKRLEVLLQTEDYAVECIKLSSLIARQSGRTYSDGDHGADAGRKRFDRASSLQDHGDELRAAHGDDAVAALAIGEIKRLRDKRGLEPGRTKIAFILDSIKHTAEVDLLRKVYDQSFRLVAVHCDRTARRARLIGNIRNNVKYAGVSEDEVQTYIDRDEKDAKNHHGQQVRDAFYVADYFLDNSEKSSGGENLTDDLLRFCNLVLGNSLVRPKAAEKGMYHAHSAALQSSCLSRQVGAALVCETGTLVATGCNDVPKFGGGVYDEDCKPDHRCFRWEWQANDKSQPKFHGCHNQRRKSELRQRIGTWLAETLAPKVAEAVHPSRPGGFDLAGGERAKVQKAIAELFNTKPDLLDGMPGVKDLIEYSRSIHAEMDALFSAARSGISPVRGTLYTTTYPCHNCARHLVTAGIRSVVYIEPYVKSLASELHSDAIRNERPSSTAGERADKMEIVPFTGVGPRMYEDYFFKRVELKDGKGAYVPPTPAVPVTAVRLLELRIVEEKAAQLVPETNHE
ncbi:anti-phage dCTP deaminase [Pinisolibacter sp.]|uniref:anti-phage dCTP deaminase n=1 Tax=Pinisolibacter sp. TaxID=2172024 RepID=UPI002FDEBE39